VIGLSRVLETARWIVAFIDAPDDPNRRGNSYAVTLMTPIERGRVDDLREVLADFEPGPGSPLARLPGVHFARWVVIDELKTDWEGAPHSPPRLKSAYLLFTADVTAPAGEAGKLPASFYRDVAERMTEAADDVWSHCRGYPGRADDDAFVEYLASSQLGTSLYYAAFPDVTVGEIRHALTVHDGLVEFVQTHQGVRRPAELQQEYLQAAGAWFT
jgi:hypothetical protein